MGLQRTILAWMSVFMAADAVSAAGSPAATLPEEQKLVVEGNNHFALDLYAALRDGGGNLFFSPYSISAALGMTYAGARGTTEEQMAKTLCFPTSAETLARLKSDRKPMTPEECAKAFGGVIRTLNDRGAAETYVLRVANALWGQQGDRFLQEFADLVKQAYGGTLQNVDFVGAVEQARQTINTWVAKETNDKIKDLIQPGILNAATRLVLTNAIYFKGRWAQPFDDKQTVEASFTRLDGSTVQTPMMSRTDTFGYAEAENLQILQLPYAGGDLAMVILLPREAAGIKPLQEQMTAESLAVWLGRVGTREVHVSIPKFKMTSRFRLESVLGAMGMPDAFSRNADFSGMTGSRDLYISAVIHQAYVDVNEEGTEAAAATAVITLRSTGRPESPPTFKADHPFMFLIRDQRSGGILFLGRMLDPTAQ